LAPLPEQPAFSYEKKKKRGWSPTKRVPTQSKKDKEVLQYSRTSMEEIEKESVETRGKNGSKGNSGGERRKTTLLKKKLREQKTGLGHERLGRWKEGTE